MLGKVFARFVEQSPISVTLFLDSRVVAFEDGVY
jgi:hypothetical protein